MQVVVKELEAPSRMVGRRRRGRRIDEAERCEARHRHQFVRRRRLGRPGELVRKERGLADVAARLRRKRSSASGIDFVIVRPAMLVDHAATGNVKVFQGHDTAHKITRADVAQFCVDQLTSDEHVGGAVTIANS
jgi:NAD(P)H-binding